MVKDVTSTKKRERKRSVYSKKIIKIHACQFILFPSSLFHSRSLLTRHFIISIFYSHPMKWNFSCLTALMAAIEEESEWNERIIKSILNVLTHSLFSLLNVVGIVSCHCNFHLTIYGERKYFCIRNGKFFLFRFFIIFFVNNIINEHLLN